MPDPQFRGRQARVRRLVRRIVGRADGECGQVGTELPNRPAHQPGVHASAEKRTHGDVGVESPADGGENEALGLVHSVSE